MYSEVVIIIRKSGLLILILCVLALSGCQNGVGHINANRVSEILLIYHALNPENVEAPFETKTLTEAASIKIVAEAMNKSKKMNGELDYGIEFNMKVIYKNGKAEDYYLTLRKDKGYRGLLVSAENSSQGYSIPVKYSDKLRELLY
ncbi:hypothetical protein [Paenibacillus wynnii]|uniref:YhfM-like domain-containing protein n=1 Tax=Paenibacillus wynnii TaxID=268407 RepID=A0A098M4V7_9BACL|nr:hypothetical protein [Paenibacillus wynnii]KGE16582.1 hypothetical protein PWYN_17870 [Paenibacillus wynnii]